MDNLRRRNLLGTSSSGIDIDPTTGRGKIGNYEVVDLGLPSGLLWATCNVGATKEEDYGNYYEWNANLATQVMGEGWRIPTVDEMYELVNYTTHNIDSDTINGISGLKFISKTNPNAYIFIPFAGYYKSGEDNLEENGEDGYVWSSEINDNYYVTTFHIKIRQAYYTGNLSSCKIPVRGVYGTCRENKFVDLGLPSGLKWASGNLLKSRNNWKIAYNEFYYGDFWSWGNVGDSSSTGYMSSAGGTMTLAMYDSTTGSQLTGDIPVDATYDVARNRLGYPWRLPTSIEFDELINNTDHEWTFIGGIYGRKFMKKTDHSVYVFFPASGDCINSGIKYRDSNGYYWSSTFSSSTSAYRLNVKNSSVTTGKSNARYYGFTIRPVQD